MIAEKWFTIEEIDAETYVISEYGHWEETHCYLVCGKERAVLIDTGLGVSCIQNVVRKLTDLPVCVMTTHVHWDHIGGHNDFEDVSVHKSEKEWLEKKFPLPLSVVKENLMSKPCDFPEEFSIENYQIVKKEPQGILSDGDIIQLGSRELKVVHTPGHSPGHCCFYESERKYLYSGDLVYKGCLDMYYESTDPQLFLESIKKVKSLDISRILPGHHELTVPVQIIDKIESALGTLFVQEKLQHGSGVFNYGDFQIHI